MCELMGGPLMGRFAGWGHHEPHTYPHIHTQNTHTHTGGRPRLGSTQGNSHCPCLNVTAVLRSWKLQEHG